MLDSWIGNIRLHPKSCLSMVTIERTCDEQEQSTKENANMLTIPIVVVVGCLVVLGLMWMIFKLSEDVN